MERRLGVMVDVSRLERDAVVMCGRVVVDEVWVRVVVVVVVLDVRIVHGDAEAGVGMSPAAGACATVSQVAEGADASAVAGVGVVDACPNAESPTLGALG